MLSLDKKGTEVDRKQGQISGGGESGREGRTGARGRGEVSNGLSGWALADSVLGLDVLGLYIKPSMSFPGQWQRSEL